MLIAKLIICGLSEPYLKFKTPVSIYAIESCLWCCELCLHHRLNHLLTAAESICVCNKININHLANGKY